MKVICLRALCVLLALVTVTALVACKKEEEELEENQLAVTWHMGRVDATAQTLTDEEGYSYSDVITMAKKGTKITFADDNTLNDGDDAVAKKDTYIISHWVKDGEEWVLEDIGDHYRGAGGDRFDEISNSVSGNRTEYTYVTTFDNESIRLCYRSGQTEQNTKKMTFAKVYSERTSEEGTLKTTSTLAYKDYQLNHFVASSAKDYADLFAGKTIYLMGDSNFDAEPGIDPDPYIWPNLLAEKYGMTLGNWGISGSAVSNYSYTDENENTTAAYKPMCERIDRMGSGAPDIVIFQGGGNDLNIAAPLGSIWTDETKTELSYDTKTVYGAINDCIRQLREKYPNAMIIGSCCSNYTGTATVHREDGSTYKLTRQQYAEAMLNTCAANGIPALNFLEAPTHLDDLWFRNQYCRGSYNYHLNIDGMILIEPYFEEALAAAYAAFLATK